MSINRSYFLNSLNKLIELVTLCVSSEMYCELISMEKHGTFSSIDLEQGCPTFRPCNRSDLIFLAGRKKKFGES